MHHLCFTVLFTVLITNDHSLGQESCPGEGKGDQDS